MKSIEINEVEQALRLLNLEDGLKLTARDVKERARAYQAQNHPDRGGSTVVSQEVNAARDTLLNWLKAGCRDTGWDAPASKAFGGGQDEHAEREEARRQNREFEDRNHPDAGTRFLSAETSSPSPDGRAAQAPTSFRVRWLVRNPGRLAKAALFSVGFAPVVIMIGGLLPDLDKTLSRYNLPLHEERIEPLSWGELGADCMTRPTAACRALGQLVSQGEYTVLSCVYGPRHTDKTGYVFYIFWNNKVPDHIERYEVRNGGQPLLMPGTRAVAHCPPRGTKAEWLYQTFRFPPGPQGMDDSEEPIQ